MLVAVAVVAISGFGIVQRVGARDVSLPQQITVNDRTYERSARVEDVNAAPRTGQWTQVATVPTTHQSIFAWVVPGDIPTAVFVQLTPTTYVEYTVVGGS